MIDPASLQNWIDPPDSVPPLPFAANDPPNEIDKALDTLAEAFRRALQLLPHFLRHLAADVTRQSSRIDGDRHARLDDGFFIRSSTTFSSRRRTLHFARQ